MKPSPYTDRYSPQEIDRFYSAGLWSADTFHDLLLRRVKENPDKVFATDGTRSLTYRELFDGGRLRVARERVHGVLHRVGGKDLAVVGLGKACLEISIEQDMHGPFLEVVAVAVAGDPRQPDP